MFAKVYIDIIQKELDRPFDYLVPAPLQEKIKMGIRVLVPFGKKNKLIEAYVVKIHTSLEYDESKLKGVHSILDENPVFSLDVLHLAYWMKREYMCTLVETLIKFIQKPYQKDLRKKEKVVYVVKEQLDETIEILQNKKNTLNQLKIIELLLEHEELSVNEIKNYIGVSESTINTLKKKGILGVRDRIVERILYDNKEFTPSKPVVLTPEQREVFEAIAVHQKQKDKRPILLHGVTGSGKTEVYLRLVEEALEQGKEAIVLVPEISLTSQMVSRFKSRFKDQVAIIHSRLSLGERYEQWQGIRSGRYSVVVGARSAIFVPFTNTGLIIIDEEHEDSYKSEMRPKYHVIDVARKKAQLEGSLLILGSATPRIQDFYEAQNGSFLYLSLSRRVQDRPLPAVQLVDMREELKKGHRSIFSEMLLEEINNNLKQREQTILFLNRRGYSTFVSCRNCGYVAMCPKCDVSLTFHRDHGELKCHYCGYETKNISNCPQCSSSQFLKYFGVGTQRIEHEIKQLFPEASTLRMDVDTTTQKNAHSTILKAFQEEHVDILIGTQMIAKGLDFPNVTLVGVVAADTSLYVDDYRSPEKTFQLLTQVSGRAGRGEKEGRVIVQSYNPEHYSIQYAKRHDYINFYQQEILLRKNFFYPPYSHLFHLLITGEVESDVIYTAYRLEQYISYFSEKYDFNVLGPTPSAIPKIKDVFRWQIIVKGSNKDQLRKFVLKCIEVYNRKEGTPSVNLTLDIDPTSLL